MSIILSGIGSDIHCVTIRLIEIELQQRQVNCANLGAANSITFIYEYLQETVPNVLALSSTNGEFYNWRKNLIFLIESFPSLPIIVGGNFLIGDYDDKEMERELKDIGCAEVFSRRGSITEICNLLEAFNS